MAVDFGLSSIDFANKPERLSGLLGVGTGRVSRFFLFSLNSAFEEILSSFLATLFADRFGGLFLVGR